MRDGQHAIRITDRLPALLAINVPILTRNQVWVFKHQRSGFKRDPVLGTIRSVLVLVPIPGASPSFSSIYEMVYTVAPAQSANGIGIAMDLSGNPQQ
jgi:hypothetical protein